MQEWEIRLQQLTDSGVIGTYQYCKVDQVVLEDKSTGTAWNYFSHIHFSGKYTAASESSLIKCDSFRKGLRLFVSSYIIGIDKFKECMYSAVCDSIWNYTDSNAKDVHQIDGAFPTLPKFVANNDPTGSCYSNVIPLEKSLYGSNFLGSYYVFEIYARGEHLKELLGDKDVRKIQEILRKCKLNYRLEELPDRIGNIVCKFDIETLRTTPKRLGEYGMTYSF